MSEEHQELTNYDIGIMSAFTAVGTILAALDKSKREQMLEVVQIAMETIPQDEEKAQDSYKALLPMRGLIAGLSVGRQPQASETAKPK